jgi:arsenate reductase (glutaredoxin)
MNIVIHHNPECGTSRNVVALVEACGYSPTIVEYLQTGWTRPQLLALFAAADLTPRQALRETKSPANELGLLETGVSDDTILAHMLDHPVLVNRPIVCTAKGVKLCRPSEMVLLLLDRVPREPFLKEDGSVLDVTHFQSKSP